MGKKQTLLLFIIASLVLYSCESSFNHLVPIYEGPGGGREGGKFYAQNMVNNRFYSLYAEKLWDEEDDLNTKCVIWAEKGSGAKKEDARKIAKEYNKQIYPKVMDVFGAKKKYIDKFGNDDREVASDTMGFADYYGDGDGKLCILLLTIRDGFNPPKSQSYIAGYFSYYDFTRYDPGNSYTFYSNECDMIYIDAKYITSPYNLSDPYKTLAHEMQHLMNYVTSIDKRFNGQTIRLMDTWIDEGLSSAAEWVYSKTHNEERIKWYNDDPTGCIANGNNFFVWGNHVTGTNGDPDAILDDYATVYLFFQWLRLQAGAGAGIYNTIINSANSDYTAVTAAAKAQISGSYSDWGILLRDWIAANYIRSPDTIYGYRNESSLDKLIPTVIYGKESKNYYVDLYPGEGVYTKRLSWPSSQPEFIRCAGLKKQADYISDTTVTGYDVLLTYNANSSNRGGLTRVSIPISASISQQAPRDTGMNSLSSSRSLTGQPEAGQPETRHREPYAISAGDMLGRNGYGDEERGRRFSGLPRNRNR